MPKRKPLTSPKNSLLWVKAGGRCEFKGCNKLLYRDTFIPSFEYNLADRGHIVANSPDGPRGDKVLSKLLDTDISNLMLLCKECHKRIDSNVDFFTKEKLYEMKKLHEERIERVTSISEDNRTNLIIYTANIGQQNNPVSIKKAELAVISNNMYPTDHKPIDLSLSGNMSEDDQKMYWKLETSNLKKRFDVRLKDKIADRAENPHYSVFALAPIPLLIKLGSLLTDKTNVQVYQKIREPDTWVWPEDAPKLNFSIIRPLKKNNKVALILSISALISSTDIKKILGNDTSIWQVCIKEPNNDCIRNKSHLIAFRKIFRTVLQEIKDKHGVETTINIFPAIPISVAIEIGRAWMPKADLPLVIYDRNRGDALSFKKTITIGVKNE